MQAPRGDTHAGQATGLSRQPLGLSCMGEIAGPGPYPQTHVETVPIAPAEGTACEGGNRYNPNVAAVPGQPAGSGESEVVCLRDGNSLQPPL